MKQDLERLERLAKLESQQRESRKRIFGSQAAASEVRRLAICSGCGATRDRGEGEAPTFQCEACSS
jgi:hypothetical protein